MEQAREQGTSRAESAAESTYERAVNLVFGTPLATEDEKSERIGPLKGIPIFGLDALSSAAYGPEAAMTLLIPLGMAGVVYIWPISLSVVVLLGIVYFSYRQTIEAYPQGGGSYTVASENLGVGAGLLAASSLMIDYVLTAAVGISAGVGALVSAVPRLQPHTLAICLGILAVLTFVNLRGVRETGGIFLLPTYLFIACLLVMIAVGVIKSIAAGGHPVAVVAAPKLTAATASISAWLLLRAFASGCTAMTGVEAVSNGVMAFKEPTYKKAQGTLTIIIAILMVMLIGIAYLAPKYGVAATAPGAAGYQSVLSQLLAAITGKGWFYWTGIVSILVVLSLSANTAFADFPRLSHSIAVNGYLPFTLTLRGRRLVFIEGIWALALLTGILLMIFGGVTDRLIPLYAVGAFMAFTLSQAGMVVHWKRVGGKGASKSMFVNGLGATATAITTGVVLFAKFTEGAWITMILIPALIVLMYSIKRHYVRVERELQSNVPVNTRDLCEPIVLIPVDRWSVVTEKALRFAWTLSKEIRIIHVECGDQTETLCREWERVIKRPAEEAELPIPELVLLKSPFRFIVKPIVDYALKVEHDNHHTHVAFIVPELVQARWYYLFLHNNRAAILRTLLLLAGSQRSTIINVPWHLKA